MYVADCRCGGACGDGLGFPIIPIIMGAVAAFNAIRGRGERITEEDARGVVRQLFLEILEREPNYPGKGEPGYPGAWPYVECLLRRERAKGYDEGDPFGPGTCSIDDLRTNILSSQEYRDLQMRKAAAVYGPGGSASVVGGDLFSGGIGGIPFTWIAVGLGLVLLLKR